MLRQPGCWLGSSHSFKECVTAHWSSDRASMMNGHQVNYRSYGESRKREEGRGAFYVQRIIGVSLFGAHRKANVGISNDNPGEKPGHRKTKVS